MMVYDLLKTKLIFKINYRVHNCMWMVGCVLDFCLLKVLHCCKCMYPASWNLFDATLLCCCAALEIFLLLFVSLSCQTDTDDY